MAVRPGVGDAGAMSRRHEVAFLEPAHDGEVEVGERVRLHDLDSGERLDLELVGPLEADPSAGRVSVVSPLGKALVGLRRGQVAGVDAPLGRRRFRVVAVEPPAPAA